MKPTTQRPLHHRVAIRLLRVFVPPLGARHHTHYAMRPYLLYVDTALAFIVLTLAGTLVVLRLQTPPEPARGDVAVRVDGPAHVVSGVESEYRVTVTNAGAETVGNADVLLVYPEDLSVLAATPEARNRERTEWRVPALDAGGTHQITLRARVRETEAREIPLKAQVRYTAQERRFADAATFVVNVAAVDLAIAVGEPDVPLLRGTPFPIALTVLNGGTRALDNLVLELSVPVTLTMVDASGAIGEPLQWKDLAVPAASSLRRMVTVRADSPAAVRDVTARVLLQNESGGLDEIAAAMRAITVLPATSLEAVSTTTETDATIFAAEARYSSEAGVQFGDGPLPPRVGQTTTYRIFWAARADAATFASATVSAILPKHVAWGGTASATAGTTPVYNGSTRTVTWSLSELSEDGEAVSASFDVMLTPAAAMVAAAPTLLSASRLQVMRQDGTISMRTAPLITTALPELSKEEQRVRQ